MDIPQTMLLDWARRLGKALDATPDVVNVVRREIATYATANADEQWALQRGFYNRHESQVLG